MRVPGSWKEGYVLDYHTRRSDFLGYDEFGHPRFDTARTEVGDLLYRLKYKGQTSPLDDLIAVAVDFLRKWAPPVDVIVPVPATRKRKVQPVLELATRLAKELQIPLMDVIQRKQSPRELKNVFDFHERIKLLEGTHDVASDVVSGRSVLLVDDLYRSGATLNAVTDVLYQKGGVSAVYVFAPTRTRSAS
jgi:predicted amidophosphoribosyltransferase